MPLVAACLRAADERKAEQLTAIRVRHLTYVTSFFVFVTGLSRTQISAIARRIEERVESELSRKPMSTSFRGVNATPPGRSGWVTIDYGDVIVNIMSPEARSYYDIESLWSRGEAVDVDRVLGTALQTRVTGSVEADMAGATHQTMKDDAPVVEEDDEWDLEPGGEASFATDFAPLEDVFPAHAEGRTSPQTFSNDVDSEFDQHEKDPLGK
jgi:ribosome-associated protein